MGRRGVGSRTIAGRAKDKATFVYRYRAQNGTCYLCGKPLLPMSITLNGYGVGDKSLITTRDHVYPRKNGNGFHRNTLYVHAKCNSKKKDRMPYACEVMFLEITEEIFTDLKAKDSQLMESM